MGIGDVPARIVQEELRRESGVLAAGGPYQSTERQIGIVQMERIHKVPDLAAARQRQDLVGSWLAPLATSQVQALTL